MLLEEGYTREVIPASPYASKKTVITAALIPLAVSVPLIYKTLTATHATTTIPVTAPAMNVLAQPPTYIPVTAPEVIPAGFIADSSLEMLANVLDPLISLMVAISFPIASVIMIGGAFFFMLGNSEKAWQTIFNAGLGYVVIQMSPLFLQILRSVGEAI